MVYRNTHLMTSRKYQPGFILNCLLALVLGSSVMNAMAAAPGDIRYERRANDSADAVAEMSSFPPSIFPHWIHRINYRCDACHDSLFKMEHGGTPVTMDLMKAGKVCGACHNGQLAFGSDFQSCGRCHVKTE